MQSEWNPSGKFELTSSGYITLWSFMCNNTLYVTENSETKKENKIPSLRPHFNREERYNELHVTPEFQAFVAKHLVKIIDR